MDARMMKYAMPKTTPSTSNACGVASDTTSIAAIDPNTAIRTAPSSGASPVIQAQPAYSRSSQKEHHPWAS